MKKYLNLTTNEAILYFIQRDYSLAPSTAEDYGHKISDLKNLSSDLSVSITLATHRTKPDYDKDKIVLKNLISDTEKQISFMTDKRKAATIMENIREAQEHIDFSHNFDGLVLYANDQFSSVVKVPVALPEQITIGQSFNVVPLYMARQQVDRYWVISATQERIRLIEVLNDKALYELHEGDFPFIRDIHYKVIDPVKLRQDVFEENMIKEFFNDADKSFRKYYLENPLPVVLVGDVKMLAYYESQMDNDCMVIARVHGNYDYEKPQEVINRVVPAVREFRKWRQEEYLSEMDRARSGKILMDDIHEIYRNLLAGNAETLLISSDYRLRGAVKDNQRLVTSEPSDDRVVLNDTVSEILDLAARSGAKVIFTDPDTMRDTEGIALIQRYDLGAEERQFEEAHPVGENV